MRIETKIVLMIFLIMLTSCKVKSYREKNANYFNLSDQLNFIESNIINTDNIEFTIDIRFGHNTIKTLKSEFKVNTDSVRIKTLKETNYKKIVDTTFSLSKKEIIKEIEYQKNNSKDIIILAGYYQNIKISRNDRVINYPTIRIAGYLIEFLETGKKTPLIKHYS